MLLQQHLTILRFDMPADLCRFYHYSYCGKYHFRICLVRNIYFSGEICFYLYLLLSFLCKLVAEFSSALCGHHLTMNFVLQLGFMLLALIWKFDFSPFMVLVIAILNDGMCTFCFSMYKHVFANIFVGSDAC